MDQRFKLPLLLYDHECTLCKRFKMTLERIEGSEFLTMISIHEKEVYEEYPFLNEEKCHESLHIIDEAKNVYVGGEAIQYLIGHFPQVSKFAWLYESDIGKKTIDFFYDTANKYRRSLLNRCSGCKKK